MKGYTSTMNYKETDLKIQQYFPTVIGNKFNVELRNKMLPIVKDILNSERLTYEWGYKNTYSHTTGLEELPEMAEFVDYIKNVCEEYLLLLGYQSYDIKPNIFASEMHKGDSHSRHAHPNSTLSGVFYLDMPQGSSDIVFYDPRPFRDVKSLPRTEENIINASAAICSPENGMLLIWESWLNHEVLANQSETGRITLVFNA